jgi:flavin reductase (DIM6/NTAB) family NADH-FMN oxidoreductase RutF
MKEFDDLVTQLDPAMAIVTTVAGDERGGCLIGFHTQCSIDPPRYVVWLSKANHTYRVGLHARQFAVHFLGEDDLELARLFGTTTGDEHDKFGECRWAPDPDGVPLLEQCPSRFVATKVALLDEGSDHVCLVLAPRAADVTRDLRPMRLSQTKELDPGHEAHERPQPAIKRTGG